MGILIHEASTLRPTSAWHGHDMPLRSSKFGGEAYNNITIQVDNQANMSEYNIVIFAGEYIYSPNYARLPPLTITRRPLRSGGTV